MTEKANEKKTIDVLSILEEAESTPKESRVVRVSSAKKTTLFKSSLYKRGQRTETSLIDEAIIEAVKASHEAGRDTISYYALTKVFQALNPNHVLKSVSRIPDHVEAKQEVFSKFFDIQSDQIKIKDSILIALNLEVEKPQDQKTTTKLKKKA